jgi:hypothetical protein
VLAYCITEREKEVKIARTGVRAAPIRRVTYGVLRCFVSNLAASVQEMLLPEAAAEFGDVLQQIFAQTTIIPFRFPTVVDDENQLREFVEKRAHEYGEALLRLRNKVQIDVRITGGTNAGTRPDSRSGKEYLEDRRNRNRQVESTLEDFRRRANSVAEGWIERDIPSGARGFVLIDRSAMPVFMEQLRQIITPDDISARVTGPWPPSEFVEIVRE